jgi:hypothetical protein
MKHAVRFEFRRKELQHLSGCIEGIGQHAAHVRVIRPPPLPVSETAGVVVLRQSWTSLPLLQLLQPHPVQCHVEAAGTVQQDNRSPLYDIRAQQQPLTTKGVQHLHCILQHRQLGVVAGSGHQTTQRA